MKSKITKIQKVLMKGILIVPLVIILTLISIYVLDVQKSTTIAKIMQGEIGSIIGKAGKNYNVNETEENKTWNFYIEETNVSEIEETNVSESDRNKDGLVCWKEYWDLNDDNEINNSDLNILIDALLDTEILNSLESGYGDLNKDGKVNTQDRRILADFMVDGKNFDAPVEKEYEELYYNNLFRSKNTSNSKIGVYKKEGADGARFEIQKDTSFKKGDILEIEIALKQYLYMLANGESEISAISKELLPKVTLNDETSEKKTLSGDYKKDKNTLIYTLTISDEEMKVNNIKIDFTHNGYGNDTKEYSTYYSSQKSVQEAVGDSKKIEKNISFKGINLEFDGREPALKTKSYVNVNNESKRYNAGTKICIDVAATKNLVETSKAPELRVSFEKSGLGKNNYQSDPKKGNAVLEATVQSTVDTKNTITGWKYYYIIHPGDEGMLQIESCEKLNITDINRNTTENIQITHLNDEIYADNRPPVIETLKKGTIDNNGEISFILIWSEEVNNFTKEDIYVEGGQIISFKGVNNSSEVDKYVADYKIDLNNDEYSNYPDADELQKRFYAFTIKANTKIGDTGKLKLAVEQGACTDLVGHLNVRREEEILIDRKAPILLSLEAYATSNISVNKNVDTVKEYYKEGNTVTVVATFSENIESTTEVPTLALQFSESGNAKGTVNAGTISGNKITYTYSIADEDNGTLSVKGFSGTVLDAAGNATIVTKRNLIGDTIIADTKKPTLKSITAIAPNFEYDELLQNEDTKRYGVKSKTGTQNTITIIAEFSENIYVVNTTNGDNGTSLSLKFGNGTGKEATFNKVENNKIYYKYDISNGDIGTLDISSYTGHVRDMAGNDRAEFFLQYNNVTKKYYEDSISEENKVKNITADTKNSTFTITATAVNKDDNENEITGNKIDTVGYYRKGSVITIKAETDEYVYKYNNKELTRFAENGSDAPQLNISFSTSGNGVGTCTSVEYINNQTIFTYTYEVKENDNGTLTLNIVESQGYDIALNGNDTKTQTITTIVSDTVRPNYADQPGIEYMNSGYKVTFNENLYYLNENNEVTSFGDINQAPLLKFEEQKTEYKPSISENVITYEGNYINAKPYLGTSRLCDKAGNLYAYYDLEAPILLNNSLEVISPETGTYKAGQEITIVATFSEKVTGIAPILALQFSESGDAKGNVSNGVIAENTITYKYTITATDAVGNGDNGVLSIKSFTGTGLKDLSDNLWKEPESVNLAGNKITADTTAPTLTIKSDTVKTNEDIVYYTFKWSEKVTGFTAEDIEVTNGSKGTFKVTNEDENGYATEYTLEVDTTNEGRQIVKVNAGVCEDIAGNLNVGRATYNKVVIDYTKPVIRAKVNGGNYVLDNTDPENKKSTLKETIVVDEELSSLQYVWSSSETIPEEGWVSEDVDTVLVNSDINLTKEVKEEGTYYLYIKATDKAGNTLEVRTKAFVVKTSQITLTPDKTEITNKDVTVTVEYGEGLTENRKAGVSGKTQSADPSKVIVSENGTVYAEATDKAGNKVCKVSEVKNIDKIAPEGKITYETNEDKSVTAKISFNEETVITNNDGKDTYVFTKNGEFTFEFKDLAGNRGTAKAVTTSIKDETKPETPPVEEDKTAPTIAFSYTTTTATVGTPIGATITTDEDTIISYSWDNKTWTSSEGYVRSQKAIKTVNEAGTYTLYAKATDKSSNQSTVQSLQFTVVRSEEEIKNPEIIFEDLPTIQVNGVKYVKVSADMTSESITNKMDKNALCQATPKYTKLTTDNKLKTGSEITINDETKYVIVVNGDVNGDGKAGDFIEDIMTLNRYRIKGTGLSTEQILAGDINNDGIIDFIDDIMQINRYRIGIISTL